MRQEGTKMNTRTMIAGTVAVLLLAGTTLRGADAMNRFDSRPGSKVRIEGTSSVHDWQMEGKIIGGFLEVGANFPSLHGLASQAGEVGANIDALAQERA